MKSRRSWQIFFDMGQTLKLQGAFIAVEEEAGSDLKWVLFSLVTPPHFPSTEKIRVFFVCLNLSVFYLHKQQTPNPDAQDPDAVPPLVRHSLDV